MVASWFVWFMAAAVFVSMVLLAVVCLQCRNKGPLASIRQGNASDDYIQSEFRVIHPAQPTGDLNSVHSPLHLSPFSSSAERRQRSVTPTETESNPSYENPAAGSDYPESDADDPGYIIVLPDGEAGQTNQSRASTPSSDALHDYENVSPKKEDTDYLNVDCPLTSSQEILGRRIRQHSPTPSNEGKSFGRMLFTPPGQFRGDSDDDDDDDDDDDANYVNLQDGVQID